MKKQKMAKNKGIARICFSGKKNMGGFSTLELLIAFVVMTLGLTAVILVVFGNQEMFVDTELAQRGIYLAERNLENAGAQAIDDIGLLSDFEVADGSYMTELTISDDECFRVVTSEARWQRGLRNLNTILTSIFIDPEESENLNGDCPTTPPEDNWDNPSSLEIDEILTNNGQQASDVDVVEHDEGIFALLTTNQKNGEYTIHVVDVTDIDNVDTSSVVGGFEADTDFHAIDSYADGNNIYSFVATASSTAPLQVFQTSFPPNYPVIPPTITRMSNIDLGLTGTCVGFDPNCPEALAVEYHNNRVYVGAHRAGGDEFQVFTESAGNLTFLMSKNLSHNVNDFDVVGDWAYLATSDNTGEVIALNISGGSIPDFDDTKFDDPDNDSDGMSIYSSNQYTYLGRERDKDEHDFYILRNSEILDTSSISDGVVDSVDMDDPLCTRKVSASQTQTKECLGSGDKIVGITVWGNLAFLSTDSTDSEFQIWDVTEKTNVQPHIGCNAYQFPAKPTNIEFPGELVYTGYPEGRELGFVSVDSNDALRVIYDPDAPDICTEE